MILISLFYFYGRWAKIPIIFYNAFILSRLLNQKEKMERYEEADLIKRISPIAWRHINLYGQYEFYRKETTINIDEIIKNVEKDPIWHQIAKIEELLN